VAFLLVFAAACLIMGNGMRTKVVEVLLNAGAPRELITAVSPDMVLGESLSSAPRSQAVREVPATVEGPVDADMDDLSGAGSPSPIQSAFESTVDSSGSAFVSPGARAAAQEATAATKAADRRASPAQDATRAERAPAEATPAARPVARVVVIRPASRLAPNSEPVLAARLVSKPAEPAKPAAAKGPGKAAPATKHGGKPSSGPRRFTAQHDQSRNQAVNRQTRGPERRTTGRSTSRHSAPARSNRDQHAKRGRGHLNRRDHGPDRSSHNSRRHDSRHKANRGSQRGAGGHHDRGGKGGHGSSGRRH